jgi:translation initiation factor 2 beta subunit (eIF-2beta)/eIF-5
MININGTNDYNYRYKMQPINVKLGGFGNGMYTTINNMEEVSNAINTPSEIIYKYFAFALGSSFNEKKNTLTGHHTNKILQEMLYQYINSFVICSLCGIPELTYSLNKISSKKFDLICTCSACGCINTLKIKNKIDDKCIDLITKYLKEKEWIKVKGNLGC